jgi:hypothetical protein
MLQAKAHVGIRGQMKDSVAPVHRRSQCVQVKVVAMHHFEVWILARHSDEAFLTRRKIVPPDDLFALCEQHIDQRASNKTGRAGHKNSFQIGSLLRVCDASRANPNMAGRVAINSKTRQGVTSKYPR